MNLTKREQAMQKAKADGEMSFSRRSPIPKEYAADASLKAAWEAGRKLAERDDADFWAGKYHGAPR